MIAWLLHVTVWLEGGEGERYVGGVGGERGMYSHRQHIEESES